MKTLSFLLLFILMGVCKCSDVQTSRIESNMASKTVSEEDKTLTHQSDTLQIDFEGGISLLWDKVNDNIIRDSNFYSLSQKPININIVNAIVDTTFVSENVCSKHSSLKKGDIAFIFLMRSHQILIGHDFNMQWDVIRNHCPYFCGLLDWVEDNREYIKEVILKKYFVGKKIYGKEHSERQPLVAKLVHFQFKGIMSSDIGIEVEKAGAWIILMEGGDLSRQITRETVRLQLQRKRREGGLRPPLCGLHEGGAGKRTQNEIDSITITYDGNNVVTIRTTNTPLRGTAHST